MGYEGARICKLLGIQYFCDSKDIIRVDPAILSELVWFENPDMTVIGENDKLDGKYRYLVNMLNSNQFIWYQK